MRKVDLAFGFSKYAILIMQSISWEKWKKSTILDPPTLLRLFS